MPLLYSCYCIKLIISTNILVALSRSAGSLHPFSEHIWMQSERTEDDVVDIGAVVSAKSVVTSSSGTWRIRLVNPSRCGRSYNSFGTPPGHPLVVVFRILWEFHSAWKFRNSFWIICIKQNSAIARWTWSVGSYELKLTRSSNKSIQICVHPFRRQLHQHSIRWFRYEGPYEWALKMKQNKVSAADGFKFVNSILVPRVLRQCTLSSGY